MNVAHQKAFADPVLDSQRAFRALMNAMARPGNIHEVPLDITPLGGLPVAAAAVVLALCDFETALWVAPGLAESATIADYCAFHTGAKRAKTANQAQFAMVDLASGPFNLNDFAQGTAEYPDGGASLIVLAPSLTGGPARSLAGPGIKGSASFAVDGLPADFAAQWAANRAAFPLGVDIVFCSGSSLLALPRSTRIDEV